jgi:ABC-type nitrate/sulfonate/bicarbonate transport system substrate-binding protein
VTDKAFEEFSRRQFLAGVAAAGAVATDVLASSRPAQAEGTDGWNEWGWPKPYRQISKQSVDWLKTKGWWPLQVAWNPLWSDGNVVLFTMAQYKLLEARGIEAQYSPFLAAGLMNEAYVPGRIQIAQAGSLGLLRVIDLQLPTVAAISYPAQRQAFLVPLDSPLKGYLSELKDQKALGRPAVIGATIGSTTQMGLLIAAKVYGLQEGRDYELRNMGVEDLLTMPKGIDILALWEPHVLFLTEFKKVARVIDLVDRYELYNGYSYIRGEIEQNAPDVIQAYTDAFIEARLIARYKPDEVIAAFAKDGSQRGRDPEFIRRDVQVHVLNPKPTINYPFVDNMRIWSEVEAYQTGVMADARVLKRKFSADEFKQVIKPSYLEKTYDLLGWKAPSRPGFIPVGWTGKPTEPPYPSYGVMMMGQQAFPEPGDLVREWSFGGKAFKP